MQIHFNLASSQTAFIINYVTLRMLRDALKHWFLSFIFSCLNNNNNNNNNYNDSDNDNDNNNGNSNKDNIIAFQ